MDKNLNIVHVTILRQAYIALTLANGKVIMIPLSKYSKLEKADNYSLQNWRLISSGLGVRWEELDEDISILGILKDLPNLDSLTQSGKAKPNSQTVMEVE